MNVPQNPVKQVLTETQTVGSVFHVILDRGFIFVVDPPADVEIKLQMLEPDGSTWYDISAESGVKFDSESFDEDVINKGALKFFYAAPFMNYRLVASAAGARAWLTYAVPAPGVKE